MRKRNSAALCFCCLLLLFLWCRPQRTAFAADGTGGLLRFSLEPSAARPGETVRLSVFAREACNPAGFRLQIGYDASRFAFERVETSGQMNGNMATNGAANPVRSAYVCDASGASAPQLSGTLATYVFRVREYAAPGTAQFSVTADQFCDYSGASLELFQEEGLWAETLAPLSNAAVLEDLIPSVGALEPVFSPNRYQYALSVGSTVSEVTFTARAAEEGSVSVNRRRLNRAGEETSITIAVTAQDGKTRVPYTVIVYRAAEESTSSEPAPAYLSALVPSYGSLEPAFSREITQYALRVPAHVDDITFEAAAVQGGNVSVSRHKLNRAGTQTPISITATSSDGKVKKVYNVTVFRAEEELSSQSDPPAAYLEALVPSYGSLEPAFSREITQYALHVPAQVDDITFEAAAQEGNVSVSRHSLNRAGTQTPISITVTGEGGKTKRVYTVTVFRAAAVPSSQRTGTVSSLSSKSPASKATSKKPVSAASGSGQPEAPSAKEAYTPQPPSVGGAQEEGGLLSLPDQPLLVKENRFGAFVSGLLAAILCLAALFLLFAIRSKRKKRETETKPEHSEKSAEKPK